MPTLFWSKFLRYCAERSNRGDVRSFDGVEGAWVNATLPVNNGTFLEGKASSDEELRARQLPWAR
jgi:hypothetical protein